MAETAVKVGAKGGPGKRWAAEKDWESHRAAITQLYITENKTLLQVMEIMKRKYDFSATARMYKARFERWHLWKNERAVILSPPDSTTSNSDESNDKNANKRWATEDDWESQRATITQLYVRENKTLAKLMEVMEEDHKFHATPKMYKSRFKRWGLWKNTRAADVAEIIRQRSQSGPDQTPTQFFLNGKQVDIEKVEAYIRRRRRQLDPGIQQDPGESSTALTYRSPSPSIVTAPPSPTYLASPTLLKVGEDTFKAFRDYFDGALSVNRWSFEAESSSTPATPEGKQGEKVLLNFYQRFRHALPLLEDPAKSGAEGMKLVRICFAELPKVVQTEDPMLLYAMVSILQRIREVPNFSFLCIQLLQQLDTIATAGTPEGHFHPTRLLWRTILNGMLAEDWYRPEIHVPIVVDQLKRYLGAYHAKTIEWFTMSTFCMDASREVKEARLRSLCSAMDHVGDFDGRHIAVRMNLASHLRRSPATYDDAVLVITEILEDPRRSKVLKKNQDNLYNYLSMLGEVRMNQGNLAEAERLFRECLDIAVAKRNATDETDYFHSLHYLQQIVRAQGRIVEADELVAQRRVAIKESLERVGEEEGTG